MSTRSTTCFYSVVKNTSGAALKFGYIGDKGRQLSSNGTYSQFGNILDFIERKGARSKAAFLRDVAAGRLIVVNTPATIVYDTTKADSSVLSADNRVVTLSVPCWEVLS